jgi:lipopolysaccharide export LptBFGC system permease protein LptF
MRIPVLLSILLAGAMLWTQGWLMPAGEARLGELSERLQQGQFGLDLEPGNFIDLGRDVTLKFTDVDPDTHELRGVFFRTSDRTFTATRGRIGFGLSSDVFVDLEDGRALDPANDQLLSFAHFHFDSGKSGIQNETDNGSSDRRKGMTLPELLASRDNADAAAGWARLLWPAFTLLVPLLALVLGKPMRRSNAALGVMLGLVLLVMFVRSTGLVAATASSHPAIVAFAAFGAWVAVVWGFVRGERRWGAGFVDRLLLDAVRQFRPLRSWGERARTAPVNTPAGLATGTQ